MEKIEYLDLLKIYLKSYKLSDEEMKDILAEYDRKFDYYSNMGMQEDDVVAELGSAKEVASQYAKPQTMLQHTDIKDIKTNTVKKKEVVEEKTKQPQYVNEQREKSKNKSILRQLIRFVVVGMFMLMITSIIIMPVLCIGAMLVGLTFGAFVCMFAPVIYLAQNIFSWWSIYTFEFMMMLIIAGCSMIGFGISYVVTKFYFKGLWKYFKFAINAVRGKRYA